MSAANKNFQKLARKVCAWKARGYAKDQEDLKKTRHFPDCNGMFDNCPIFEDFQNAIEIDKSKPPERCRTCPVFKESQWYKQELSGEQADLWKKMMGRE